MGNAKEESEVLFEAYLAARGLRWDYEPYSPGPDYLIHAGNGILAEVKGCRDRTPDLPVFWADSLKVIRARIDDALDQLRPHNDKGLPGLVVLHSPGVIPDTSDIIVWGALLGDPGWAAPVDPVAGGMVREPRPAYLGNSLAQERKNTTLSAVAVLAPYGDRPGQERLRIYHNPYAAVKLPVDPFTGPFDEHSAADPESGEARCIFLGEALRRRHGDVEGGRPAGDRGPIPWEVFQRIRERLDPAADARIRRIVLFGSRATGHSRPASDYDLLIVLRGAVADPRADVVKFYRALRGLNAAVEPHVMGEEEYEETRPVVGSLAHDASRRGLLIHENP